LDTEKKEMKALPLATAILSQCFRLFATRFNNLSIVSDWIELYKVLVEASMIDMSGWAPMSLPLSFHELVSHTVLLFQALTPI